MSGTSRRIIESLHQFLERTRLSLIPAAALLAACATPTPPPPAGQARPVETAPSVAQTDVAGPEDQALQSLVALQDRLYQVAAPLLVNNPELCKTHARNLLGFTAKNRYSYSPEFLKAAERVLGLDDRLQVMGVLAGGGAERAGLRRGDILLAVENNTLPEGKNAERQAASVLAPLVTKRSSVRLKLLRNGAITELTIPLTNACAFGIELGNTDRVAAYADGYRVLVTRGMMSFVRSDEELAYVLAKEMAHNTLAHANRQRMSATIGGIIDNLTRAQPDMSTMSGLAGVKPMPQNLDGMADKLSLYLLARAGYNLDNVVPFWQRMAKEHPASKLTSYTALHPATAYRVRIMEKTLREVKAKQAAKKPLRP